MTDDSPTRAAAGRPVPVDEMGGDPACWANRVCPACGRLNERRDPVTCEACGEPFEQ